ncbi:hypothetical protein C8J57DRAFT_1330054, partial [Mycena rebaudengoi]
MYVPHVLSISICLLGMCECIQRFSGPIQDVAHAGQCMDANNGGVSNTFCQRISYLKILESGSQIRLPKLEVDSQSTVPSG